MTTCMPYGRNLSEPQYGCWVWLELLFSFLCHFPFSPHLQHTAPALHAHSCSKSVLFARKIKLKFVCCPKVSVGTWLVRMLPLVRTFLFIMATSTVFRCYACLYMQVLCPTQPQFLGQQVLHG